MDKKEIIYIPQEQAPFFRLKRSENPIMCKDFYVTCYVLNTLQPEGKTILVLMWLMPMTLIVLTAATIDIALFLIIKNLFQSVWQLITNTTSSVIGKSAKVLGIAAALFVVFVFINSGAWKCAEQYVKHFFGW